MLELARVGSKAIDPSARAFASGHAAGLEDAIKLLDQVLQTKASARIKAAAQGTPYPILDFRSPRWGSSLALTIPSLDDTICIQRLNKVGASLAGRLQW